MTSLIHLILTNDGPPLVELVKVLQVQNILKSSVVYHPNTSHLAGIGKLPALGGWHIWLVLTKDVQSQRLTVCCHSVGLSTKNEQELGLGLESMVKINDPSFKKLSKTLRSQEGAMAMS